MTTATEEILRQALRLTPIEKAELIEAIFHCFDQLGDDKVDAAWAEEVESRLDAYDAVKLAADSADSVMARINKR